MNKQVQNIPTVLEAIDWLYDERIIHNGTRWVSFTDEQFFAFHDIRFCGRVGGYVMPCKVPQFGPEADCDYEVQDFEVDPEDIAFGMDAKAWSEFLQQISTTE